MLYDDNTAALQISRGEMRHAGEYTCVATNSVGSTSCRAKLTLQGWYHRHKLQLESNAQDFTIQLFYRR